MFALAYEEKVELLNDTVLTVSAQLHPRIASSPHNIDLDIMRVSYIDDEGDGSLIPTAVITCILDGRRLGTALTHWGKCYDAMVPEGYQNQSDLIVKLGLDGIV